MVSAVREALAHNISARATPMAFVGRFDGRQKLFTRNHEVPGISGKCGTMWKQELNMCDLQVTRVLPQCKA